MENYEQHALSEAKSWVSAMEKEPSIFGRISKSVQDKINDIIPEKIHRGISAAVREMTNAVFFGSKFIPVKPRKDESLFVRDVFVKDKIEDYKRIGATEGAVTGAGGILMGLADFPLFFAIKIKLLYDIAAIYGFDTKDYKEVLYLLYIFQIAFSSQQRRNDLIGHFLNWDEHAQSLPEDIKAFDWKSFQIEYRDYLDLAKMAQLIPVIGAPVGAIANYKLIDHLGEAAMNAYRLRIVKE